MPDMGAGTLLYKYASGVETLSLSPQVPNACVVRDIILGNASADDVWVIRTNGQEVGRYKQPQVGNQNVLGAIGIDDLFTQSIFTYCKNVLGIDLLYPIPEGTTLTISSEGGATADIGLQYEEFSPSALNPSLCNYPGGKYWLCPRWFYLSAHPTSVGEKSFDKEVGLTFTPNLFIPGSFPVGWTARILDIFTQQYSVNAYASTTNHVSVTDHIAAIKSGQRLFTRDAGGGIPLVALPAAAGSANSAGAPGVVAFPTFADSEPAGVPNLATPVEYRPGYIYDWRLGLTGDAGAGADYSGAVQLAIVEYRSN